MGRFPLKELLLLLYLICGSAVIGERLGSLGLSLGLILYVALAGLLVAALLLTAYVASTALRLLYASILAASAFYLASFERIAGDHMTYDAFINMLNSAPSAGEALQQYVRSLAVSLLVATLLFAAIALKPRRALPLTRPRITGALAAPAAVALLATILFVRGGDGARGLPGAFTPLAYSSIYLYEKAAGDLGPRRPARLRPALPPAARDLVLIVDESVVGHYLDINNAGGARSGLVGPRTGVDVHNYGFAAAITNCSVGVNVTLRFGGTRADYQHINAVMPPIWDYAHRAGLSTVYIDSQRVGGSADNLIGAEERRAIDRFVQFDGVPVRDRDMAAADVIAELLGNNRAEFIYVNKVGAHFPIHDKYPDAFMRHRPALPRGHWLDVSDTGSRRGFAGTAEDWQRYRNSYRNTLDWNVGAFFDRLFERADLSNATLIYTSDHGQDLHERGRPGLTTHCASHPAMEEGLVPLVVIEGAGLDRIPWERNLAGNRNHVSHYQLFPTLLALMGYREEEVRPIYGESLIGPSHDAFTFNARFNARLGMAPDWQPIDLRRIRPLPADEGAETATR